MARGLAQARLAPHALEWELTKPFPVDVIRAAAALELCGTYVHEDASGSGLSRLAAAVIMEALAGACPSNAAYISIHETWLPAWWIATVMPASAGRSRHTCAAPGGRAPTA